jgi:hypothetical protein
MKTITARPILIDIEEIKQNFSADEYVDYLSLYESGSIYGKNTLSIRRQIHFMDKINPKKLILISLNPNEKIKVGETYYDTTKSNISIPGFNKKTKENISFKISPLDVCDSQGLADYINERKTCRKIIATQEQLTPEYIEKFIEEYNNNTVKDVEIKSVLININKIK